MNKLKLLLTQPWPGRAQAYLQSRYAVTVNDSGIRITHEQLIEAMREYDCICSSLGDQMDSRVFGVVKPRVRMIAHFGAGYENVDVAAAKLAGITVSNTPDVLTDATADMALLLMLMTTRRAAEGERHLCAGEWKGWDTTSLLGKTLEGKTLGLVGFGRIAQATARKAVSSLGMKVAYYSRSRAPAEAEAIVDARYVARLDDLAAMADILSLHTPGGAETKHMVDARLLKLMKPSAILINTANGSLVKEDDLVEALRAGVIWAAGLDVYENEPEVHPLLLSLNNAVLLPHLGSATAEVREAMGMCAAANIDRFFAGERVSDRVA